VYCLLGEVVLHYSRFLKPTAEEMFLNTDIVISVLQIRKYDLLDTLNLKSLVPGDCMKLKWKIAT
jgi:hypothetical protein